MQSTLALDGPQLHTTASGAKLFAFPTIETNERLKTATAEQRVMANLVQWYAIGGMKLQRMEKNGKAWRRRGAMLDVFVSVLCLLHRVALAAQATSQYAYKVDGVINEAHFRPMLFDTARFHAQLTLSGRGRVYQGRLVNDVDHLSIRFEFPSPEETISVSQQLDALLGGEDRSKEAGGTDSEDLWGILDISVSIDGVCEGRSSFTLHASQMQNCQLESELFGDDKQQTVAYVTLQVIDQMAARICSAVHVSEVVGVGASPVDPDVMQSCIRAALLDRFVQTALPTGKKIMEDLRLARVDPDAVIGIATNKTTLVQDSAAGERQVGSAVASSHSSDVSSEYKDASSGSSQTGTNTKGSASFMGIGASGEHNASQARTSAQQHEQKTRVTGSVSSSQQADQLEKASSSHLQHGHFKTVNSATVFAVTRAGLNSNLQLNFSRGVQYHSGTIKSWSIDLEPGADSEVVEDALLHFVHNRLDGHDRDVVRLDKRIDDVERRLEEHDRRLGNVEKAGRLTPPGTIMSTGGRVVPPGFLPCDGTTRLIADFPELARTIGITWGAAPPDTFRLPALRGKFLRGADLGDRVDPDANAPANAPVNAPLSPSRRTANGHGETNGVGSTQQDCFVAHKHGVTDPGHQHAAQHIYRGMHVDINAPNKNGVYVSGDGVPTPGSQGPLYLSLTQKNHEHPGTTGIVINRAGGKETRPVNAAVLWVIKT